MVLDYSERRTVGKNRPKKQPVGLFGFIAVGAVVVAFAGGVLTGWLIFRPAKKPVSVAAGLRTDKGALPAAAPQAGKAPAQAPHVPEPPLTFYETLPKGSSNALIGSGLNPKKPSEVDAPQRAPAAPATTPSHPAKPTPSQAAGDKKVGAPAPSPPAPEQSKDSAKNAAATEPNKEGAKTAQGRVATYTVQVASFRERKEAEATVARIVEKGLAAYIVESKVADKGVWYRIRIGKRLDQKSANELAAKAGKGAVLIPE